MTRALPLLLLLFACPSRAGDVLSCDAMRQRVDDAVRVAAASDPRHLRHPLTPWLRVDRFTHGELRASQTAPAALARAGELDRRALAREYGKLAASVRADLSPLESIDACRRAAIAELRARPQRLAQLAAAPAPSDYRSPRGFGTYALARPFLQAGAARWRRAERARADGPPPAIARLHDPALRSSLEATRIAAWLGEARAAHPAGWPLLPSERLRRIAEHFAPQIATTSHADSDRAGRLTGAGGHARVELGRPVVDVDHTLTRWGAHVLLQLSYTVWFTERPAAHPLDPYAGKVDGVVFRVTLADDGRALLWESIHACGCFYTVVLPEDRPLALRPADPARLEAPVVLTGPPAAVRPRFLLAPGTHLLGHVRAASDDVGADTVREPYALRDYERLLAAGADAAPFDAHGILRGTQRLERWFLWPSGIRSPGAMRGNGRHATAFLGERHFERHALLGDRLFTTSAP